MRTLDSCRTALDGEENGQNSIGDPVVEHVTLPLNLHLTTVLMSNHHATHDKVSRTMWRMIHLFNFFTILDPIAICLDRCSLFSWPNRVNGAKRSLQSPFDQVDSSSAERDPLLAHDRRRRQPGVLSQVFRCHQRHLKIVLYENTSDQLIVLVICVGWSNLRKFSDHFGGLIDFEWYAEFFSVGWTEDLGFQGFVRVKGEKLGL